MSTAYTTLLLLQDALADAGAVAQQSFSLVQVVRAHSAEPQALARYSGKLTTALDMQEAHDLGYGVYRVSVKAAQVALQAGNSTAAQMLLLHTCCFLVLQGCYTKHAHSTLVAGHALLRAGKLSAQQLTSFVFYLAFVQGAIYDVGDQWSKIQDALGSAREVFNLLDREPQLRVTRQPVALQAVEQSSTNGDSSSSSSSSVAAAAAAAAGIQFNDASLASCSYVHAIYCPVLSYHYTTPTFVMSIIVKLRSPHVLKRMLILLLQLLRYCHCCCHDCSYGSKELTSVVGWVPQEPALLPMTVADNIAYGLQQHEVTRQDIEYAATE
eukprot:16775-Heterococcus_DN1.PRE.2